MNILKEKRGNHLAIKIYIDQGHNPEGINAGAEGFGIREQDVTYQVGRFLYDILSEDDRFEARLSRPTPQTTLGYSNTSSLRERVTQANNWPADYFISIHCNSNTNPAINGSEVYVYRSNTQSYWLAQHILNAIVERVGTRDNGVRLNPSLYVLRRTTMPAVLVELGYLSNTSDAQKLRDDQRGFAQGIYNGLLSYFGFSPL